VGDGGEPGQAAYDGPVIRGEPLGHGGVAAHEERDYRDDLEVADAEYDLKSDGKPRWRYIPPSLERSPETQRTLSNRSSRRLDIWRFRVSQALTCLVILR
jgi:hypothetical protein